MTKRATGYAVKKPNRTTGKSELWVRFFYYDDTGKRREKMRRADNSAHARQIIKELESLYDLAGAKSLDADGMTYERLAEMYKEKRLIAPVYDDPESDDRVKGRRVKVVEGRQTILADFN